MGAPAAVRKRPSHRPKALLVDVMERILSGGIVIGQDSRSETTAATPPIEVDSNTVVTTIEAHGEASATMGSETSEALMSAADEYLRRLPPAGAPSDTT